MKFISLLSLSVAALFLAGCVSSMMPGRGGGAWKPDSATSNQFSGDLTGASVGDTATYTTEASGSTTTTTVSVVGQQGDALLVEQWMDAGSMAYGYLFAIKDKTIVKAWSAAKGDTAWTSITVNEPPAAQPAGDAPKPTIVESDESKTVKAGEFASHRVDTTVNVQGTDYKSSTWFAKNAPELYIGSEHGGLVAMEASGSVTQLTASAKDAKPTIELPAAE